MYRPLFVSNSSLLTSCNRQHVGNGVHLSGSGKRGPIATVNLTEETVLDQHVWLSAPGIHMPIVQRP